MTEPHDPDAHDTHDAHDAGQPDVGSLGEEAAKLLGALSDWARESDVAATVGGLAGHAASAFDDQHLATGSPECTVCPVCRTVHVVRSASPEVRAHLATAASSFLQAAAGVLASLPQAGGSGPGASASGSRSRPSPTRSRLERIDLDGGDDDGP